VIREQRAHEDGEDAGEQRYRADDDRYAAETARFGGISLHLLGERELSRADDEGMHGSKGDGDPDEHHLLGEDAAIAEVVGGGPAERRIGADLEEIGDAAQDDDEHRGPGEPAEARNDDPHHPSARLAVFDGADGRERGDEEEDLGPDPDGHGEDVKPGGDRF